MLKRNVVECTTILMAGKVKGNTRKKSRNEKTTDDEPSRKHHAMKAEFGEPITKEQGKPFDATTAPRSEQEEVIDLSQELQDQATTAPKKNGSQDATPSGTA